MLLVALYTLRDRFSDPTVRLQIRGDAKGVLQDVIKGRARNAGLNLMVGEAQLILADTAECLTAIHWWSEDNAVCYALSRQEIPASLSTSVRTPTAKKVRWELMRPSVRAQLCP